MSNMKGTSIDLASKERGKENKSGLTLVKRKYLENNVPMTGYYLNNDKGESLRLDLESNSAKEVLFYEFLNEKLYVFLYQYIFNDSIFMYVIDPETGQQLNYISGQIPCENKENSNWKFGNSNCEWIHLKDHRIALIKMNNPHDFKILDFNWKEDTRNLIDLDLGIGLSATNGYIVDDNIIYDSKNKIFKVKN